MVFFLNFDFRLMHRYVSESTEDRHMVIIIIIIMWLVLWWTLPFLRACSMLADSELMVTIGN